MTSVNITYKDVRTAVADPFVNVSIKGPSADKSFLTPNKFTRLADHFGSFAELVKFVASKGLIEQPRMNELLSFDLSTSRSDASDAYDVFAVEAQKLFTELSQNADLAYVDFSKVALDLPVLQEAISFALDTQLNPDSFGKTDSSTLSIQPLFVEKETMAETRTFSISTFRDDGKYLASDYLATNNDYVKPNLIVSDSVTLKLN